jgi:hypothetical protein
MAKTPAVIITAGDGNKYKVGKKLYDRASAELKRRLAADRDVINVVDAEAEGHYSQEIPPGDRTFLLAQLALEELQPKALEMNPDLNAAQRAEARNRGMVKGEFRVGNGPKWKLALNHSPDKIGRIHSGNMEITYESKTGTARVVAIIGPWLTARRCWNCGLGGTIPGNQTVGRCIPHAPCPKCKKMDWWDKLVKPQHLERDCAELLADASPAADRERRFKRFMSLRV